MTKGLLHILFSIPAGLALAQPSAAQDFYFGAGLGYASASSSEGGGGGATSEADFGVIGLTVGYRWELAAMFAAAEIDADLSLGAEFSEGPDACLTDASGPYFCTHDATVRLRGLVGAPVGGGGFEAFASAGLVAVMGTSAIETSDQMDNTNLGYTIGLGLQRGLAGGGMLRGELIYDRADNSLTEPNGYDPDFEAVTLKVTYLF